MPKTLPATKLFLELARTSAALTRRFDASLGGLSLNEFIILYNVSLSSDSQLRRSDLAEKLGLTASGITRLLLPMEKLGLVKRESDKRDGRVSFVCLASGGRAKLAEALERANDLSEDILENLSEKKIVELTSFLATISKNI